MKAYLYFSPDFKGQKLGALRSFPIDPEKEKQVLGIDVSWEGIEIENPVLINGLLNGGVAEFKNGRIDRVVQADIGAAEELRLKKERAIELVLRLQRLLLVDKELMSKFDMSEERAEIDQIREELEGLKNGVRAAPERPLFLIENGRIIKT